MKLHRFPLFLILIFLLSACTHAPTHTDKMIFRYNEAAGITTLDPAFASGQSTTWACNLLYNGLVDLDDSLRIVPSIAKSWDISADGKTYTFFLRNDIYFHQTNDYPFAKPRRVTAHDFVYSFNRIINPTVASPGAWIFQKVARDINGKAQFIALNDSTFQIQLTQFFPPFLGILSMKYCSVVPKEVVEKYGNEFRRHPVGTGPFQMQRWEEGIKLVLRKNPHYFETDAHGKRLPYLDAVAISFIVDKQSVFMEFMKGTLDFMSGIEPCYKDALLTKDGKLYPKYAKNITMETSPYLNTEYLGFVLDDKNPNNPLCIKEVRQAINYGFDRQKMMRYLRNNIGYAANSGFVPKGMRSFDSQRVKGYDYNPKKALELLAKAGFPNGEGLPPIPISTSASYLDLCQYIQHELGQIGIPITLDVQQAAQQRQMMRGYKLPCFRGSWICDYPDSENFLALFWSKNLQPVGSNYTHYVRSDYDQLFEQSQMILNDSLRNDIYTQLDSMLMEDAPVVVLYYDQAVRFLRNGVKNCAPNPTNMLDLRRTYIITD